MTRVLTSPHVEVEPSASDDGLMVTLVVPSYEDEVRFTLHCERDADGDWRVYVPWFEDLHGNPAADHTDLILENGVGVTNGVCYIGAPDAEVEVKS